MENTAHTTIEGFFLADYERIRQENKDLRRTIDELDKQEEKYGFTDLHKKTEAIRLNIAPSYYLYKGKSPWKTAEALASLLDLDDEALFAQGTRTKVGEYSVDYAAEIQERKFLYTIEFTDLRKTRTYVGDEPERLYILLGDDPDTGGWFPKEIYDDLKSLAVEMFRENIEEAIRRLEQEEK